MGNDTNVTLTKRQYKQYIEIRDYFEKNNYMMLSNDDDVRMREVLILLEMLGYIKRVEMDNTNTYRNTADLKLFAEWHKDMVREERKLKKREWKIAIISAIIGAAIGLIPSIISWIR